MNVHFDQSTRLGRLTTALEQDKLVLLRFAGSDHLNGLFEYKVEALSTEPNINFDDLIGTSATIEIESQNDGPQPFSGIVTEAKWAGVGENGNKYEITLRPWLWLAGRRRNQRIFHNQTVVQIIESLFRPYSGMGQPALIKKLSGSYPELEYTVQYRESDMDFACRLMERFGISYHFTHTANGHSMVLTDSVDSHEAVPGGSRVYKPVDGARQSGDEHFWEWHPYRRLTTGAVRLSDYNFKRPQSAMEVEQLGDAQYTAGQIESFDYPGEYLTQGDGKDVVALRTKQERGQDARHRAVGDCTSLRSGMTVTLTGDHVTGVKGETYLCLSATHSYVSDAYGSGEAQSDDYAYSGSYVFMPSSAPLAPERKTAIPAVQGPQTAKVVGEGEIDCDEFGRILVHFHWDLNKAYSMRCRVSQSWASKGWGGMVIPRTGMEVVVEFLEGNPDQPLVTGCVYNGVNEPPAKLPENKSRSVFKTKSHNGEGFNELTFEDKAGEEFIYMHAQKNLDLHVQNSRQKRVEFDDTATIGNDSNLIVANNRTETIDADMALTVKSNLSEKIEGERALTVGSNFAIKTGGDLTLKADGEIVLDASKITLVSGGAAVVVQGGSVNVAPMLNVGSASPGAAALPAIPAILKAAAGAGSPFVSHCPLKDDQ
ncbi:type VI secretion system Vgr family protein [Yoonia sp. R2-816]|uniref:type VI secretion system Vgr family protein n=1 Tax=Yoonia sp. R2-816 TaxID=3342638 RepID=UPI0037289CB7